MKIGTVFTCSADLVESTLHLRQTLWMTFTHSLLDTDDFCGIRVTFIIAGFKLTLNCTKSYDHDLKLL